MLHRNLSSKPSLVLVMILLLMWTELTLFSTGCPSDGRQCRTCIMGQMKTGCPGCGPIMQCMAKCLWAGSSRAKCVKKCDCNGGYPQLVDCRKCLSQCKCSCLASA